MFIGKYSLTLDSKGRLSVPAKFREVLATSYQASVIITTLDRCLAAYPVEEWLAISERIRELPQMKRELKDFMRHIYSAATECTLDRQGRILVPAEHRSYAYEWRRTINHCLKCEGDTCWTAPGSTKCWAVNSSDTVPVLIAMDAKLRLMGPDGEREIDAAAMFDIEDGREWLTRKPGELLIEIVIPDQGGAKSTYKKLRRRGTFDFPVLGVAARIEQAGGTVTKADIILNAVGPAPLRCTNAEQALVGNALDAEAIEEAVGLAPRAAKPLDNTDYMPSWRKKMVSVFVRRALEELADAQ